MPRVRLFGNRCRMLRRARPRRRRAGWNRARRSVSRCPGGVACARVAGTTTPGLEMFALTISELRSATWCYLRAREPLLVAAAAIRETVNGQPGGLLRQGPRLGGGSRDLVGVGVCRHLGGVARHSPQPRQGRGRTLFGAVQPMVWVSICWAASAVRRIDWQVCLAHLLRDARYAVEVWRYRLLRRVQASAARDCHRATPGHAEDTTLKHYHADLDRQLDRIMAAVPIPVKRSANCASGSASTPPTAAICSSSSPATACRATTSRTEPPSQRDLSQGHQRVPLPVGETYAAFRSVVSTTKSQPRFGACRPPVRVGRNTTTAATNRGGVSNYN